MKEAMTSEVEKNKLYVEQPTSEPKVKAFISAYEPLRIENCEKCGKVIAEPKELIRIVKHRRSSSPF